VGSSELLYGTRIVVNLTLADQCIVICSGHP